MIKISKKSAPAPQMTFLIVHPSLQVASSVYSLLQQLTVGIMQHVYWFFANQMWIHMGIGLKK